MTIRDHLNKNESMDDLGGYKELFLGHCCGVALVNRSANDNHIAYLHLVEDDGNWSVRRGTVSSYWLEDEMNVLKAVQEWIQKNAEPDVYEGHQFGWKFRKP